MKAVDIIWDVNREEELELLPTEIEIPEDMEGEEEIGDYLSDVTGFCHKGYYLVESEGEIGSNLQEKQAHEDLPASDRKDQAVSVFTSERCIDKKEIEYMETLLEMTGAQIYDRYGLKRDETVTRTLCFQDGSEMDVKVVICEREETPYIDIVLFDKNGCEMVCDTGDCSIEGEYAFDTKGGIYKGVIRAKERAVEKPVAALDKMIDQAMQQAEIQAPGNSHHGPEYVR